MNTILSIFGLVTAMLAVNYAVLFPQDAKWLISAAGKAHNWIINQPTLYLISCGGVVLLFSWLCWLIGGGKF